MCREQDSLKLRAAEKKNEECTEKQGGLGK